ncbi:MAG: RecQ family ATP-dependent DNA helicase [Treponema sp.]|nr:RecQ family ATP-dependent DNA helicase [Treponema sp.]
MENNNDFDPLSNAARKLFGLPYLFPYQRLVISNLLEAACTAGIAVNWPGTNTVPVNDRINEHGAVNDKTGDVETENEELQNDSENPGSQIVILPTGAGKSLCFQLPAMLLAGGEGLPGKNNRKAGPTLVIYPILSLMADQERRLAEKGFSPVLLRGGQSEEEREAVWKKLRAGESKFIIANPEVLLTRKVQERLPELGIIHTVIDEAHCVSEWGESFRPSYLEIHTILKAAGSPLVTAFTATASEMVLEKIKKYIFGDIDVRCITGNPDRPNIEYRAAGCMLRNMAVQDFLLANSRPAIVFCSSRPGTERLAKYLRNRFMEMGLSWAKEIRFYHAGLSREEKKETENWYFENKDAVLIATCAYGLGVDKADIRTVIHRDCPPTVEAYLQESGRAGRDGKQSRAILLWGPEDTIQLKRAKTEQDKIRLEQLFAYARNNAQCRREALLNLLNYEGDNSKPEKQCCDVCAGESNSELREENSIVNFFRRNSRSYSAEEAARILMELETWSEEEAGEAINILIKKGSLTKYKVPFWKNRITVNLKNATL